MHVRKAFAPALVLSLSLIFISCSHSPTQSPQSGTIAGGQPVTTQAGSANQTANSTALISNLATHNGASPEVDGTSIVIPAGTSMTVRLQQSLSSGSAVPGQRFEAVLDEPILVNGHTVVPIGALAIGHVVAVHRSGRLRHPGQIALTLDTVSVGSRQVAIDTTNVVAKGGSHKKRNLAWIGGGTGGGALIGALAAGGKGALIGSGIGAAAGTTTAFLTGKKDAGFAAERRLHFRLSRDAGLG